MNQIEMNFSAPSTPSSKKDGSKDKDAGSKTVGLFVTCLVDLFRPTVGFAAVKLLEDAGFTLEVPKDQTCCGQPAYNSGDKEDAKALAKQVIKAFENYDYVVAPSGSCAGMIRKHYPSLLADEPQWAGRAAAVAGKTYELVSFSGGCGGNRERVIPFYRLGYLSR